LASNGDTLLTIIETQRTTILTLQAEIAQLKSKLFIPEVDDFVRGVEHEAAHQRLRWGSSHDEGKEPADWFWLVGYLAGKALNAGVAGDLGKLKHHCISTAAALANWHAFASGTTNMRPGVRLAE
jgi:hypothetical protein